MKVVVLGGSKGLGQLLSAYFKLKNSDITEFGKTPLYSKKQLEGFGYNIAIDPLSSLRIAMGAIEPSYAALKE